MDTIGLSEIVKTVGDVGIMLVISSVVIYAMIKGINVFFDWIDTKVGKRKHDELLEIRNRVDAVIQDDIHTYLENHDTHRVQVIEFSNSVSSVTYLPFKYANCTYEAFDIDRDSEACNIDKIATSLFTPFLIQLYNSAFVELNDSDMDMRTYGGAVYDILRRCKEHRCVYVMIKSNSHKSVGYVCAYKDSEFTEEDITDLEAMAIRLSAQLCVLDNKESR